MIGANIRGFRHLWRVSDFSLKKILVATRDGSYYFCDVIKTPKNSQFGEKMFILNTFFHQSNYKFSTIYNSSKQMQEILSGVRYDRIIEINPLIFGEFYSLIRGIILLPDTFDDDYEAFLKENSKMVNNLCSKYSIPSSDNRLKQIYIYSDGSKNFFQWAVDLYFKAYCSLHTIKNILSWNENYKQLTKKLSKGTITAYTSLESIELLTNELIHLRKEKRIGDAINSFNTAQKKLLKNNELSKIDKDTLSRFSKLSETKRINFIKKASTIEDFQELMRQIRHVTSMHFEWSKESFMDFIKNVDGIKYEVVYENDNVVLVRVDDYETIKQLGKTTNWCISKNKTYWDNYIESKYGDSVQYMIFDFSKLEDENLSIVGFTTTRNKGITSAHNFINQSLMDFRDNVNPSTLKSYLERFNECSNIYKILENCDININLIAHYDKPQYKWSYEHFMEYLYECVDKDNVDIIKHDGDKLVLSVRDENIKYFFGDSYMDNISNEDCGFQHIIFADFSKNQYDPNKMFFAIICDDSIDDEDYCYAFYNEYTNSRNTTTFESILSEFDVPYDIIRRPVDVDKKIKNAFLTLNASLIRNTMKYDKDCLNRVLTLHLDEDNIYHIIHQTIIEYLSFDYLKLIYDSCHQLTDYMDANYVSDLVVEIFDTMRTIQNRAHKKNINVLEKPSNEKIKAFYEESLKNRSDTLYIGFYLLLKEILMHETATPDTLYQRLTSNIISSRTKGELVKEILYIMIDKHDMSDNTLNNRNIIDYFIRFGDKEMKDTIKNLSDKYDWVKECYEYSEKRSDKKSFIDYSQFIETVDVGGGMDFTAFN